MSSLKNRNIAVTRYPDRYMRIIPTPEKLYITIIRPLVIVRCTPKYQIENVLLL